MAIHRLIVAAVHQERTEATQEFLRQDVVHQVLTAAQEVIAQQGVLHQVVVTELRPEVAILQVVPHHLRLLQQEEQRIHLVVDKQIERKSDIALEYKIIKKK